MKISRNKQRVFRIICVLAPVVAGVCVYFAFPRLFDWRAKGMDMNQGAWEASYRERGLPVPEKGPREGYWGVRQEKGIPDPDLGWRESTQYVSELLHVDDYGRQFYISRAESHQRILIIGGSVAFGWYASKIKHTYFNVLGRELEQQQTPTEIVVMASGAWKASQELVALQQHAPLAKPNLVIFLNGLNDLTAGARYDTHFGVHVETLDGSTWDKFYHTHDYAARVKHYLQSMRKAADYCGQNGLKMLVVLQPSLADRGNLSEREKKLLEASLEPHKSRAALMESYDQMRAGLRELAEAKHVWACDCSKVFDDEKQTTFSDLWHFSDFGHKILGQRIAAAVAPIFLPETDDAELDSSK